MMGQDAYSLLMTIFLVLPISPNIRYRGLRTGVTYVSGLQEGWGGGSFFNELDR
jgi:hypothetical protein